MDLLASKKEFCYCAFCRSPRSIYTRKRVGLFHVLANAFGAALFSVLAFEHLDPRGILIFILFMGITETFLQVRRRVSLVCRECDFDPILYLKDAQKAVEKVQAKIQDRKQDPVHLFSDPLNLPFRKEVKKAALSLRV